MAVYVDNARIPYGRMLMSHMVADSLWELHHMAHLVGLRRKWFQPVSFPHYDICLEFRRKAVALGAVEIGRKEIASFMREYRKTEEYSQHRASLVVGRGI